MPVVDPVLVPIAGFSAVGRCLMGARSGCCSSSAVFGKLRTEALTNQVRMQLGAASPELDYHDQY